MIEIGLTGGIGSGKSTVAQRLVACGALLIDADLVVRELQAPNTPVVAAMVAAFGPEILHPDGSLNRPAVAGLVFGHPENLAKLNAIVHPAVTAEMTTRRQALAHTDAVVLLDIPLLIETKYRDLQGIIVVDVDPALAVERLVAHRGFSTDDAWARINSQVAREERLSHADFVIDNSGSPDALDEQIDRCWAWMTSRPPRDADRPIVPIRGRGDA